MSRYKLILALVILVFSDFLYSQNSGQISKIEAEKFKKLFEVNQVNYPGDSTIDVKYYKLNLTLTINPDYLSGDVTVNAISKSSGLTAFFLDLANNMIVDSILLGSQKLNFTHSNNQINITLDRTYLLNEFFGIRIFYEGVPNSSGFGSFTFGTHNGQPAIYTLSEPYGSSDWWPCKDTPADKADSADIWITCNSSLTGVSNGKLVETVGNGNGTVTYKWKCGYPIAQYLISLAITNYTLYTNYFKYSPTDSMIITHYIYPEDFANYKPNLDKTPLMLQIFSQRYGLYPFIKEKYGHAEFGWSGGMEHQTCTSIGDNSEETFAHELTHQWFGDKVTCKDWHNIWLNEGFASYGEAVYYEAVSGQSGYNQVIQSKITSAKTAVGSVYAQDISNVNAIFDYARSYAKGSVVLHMLRGIAGDSAFFNILRTYLTNPNLAYNCATTEDFEAAAESVYGSSLSYFFQEWIYGENYPKYIVSWKYTPLPTMWYKVDFTISQTTNTNPVFFTMPIQIEISATGVDTLFTVFNNQQNQSFSINLPFLPTNFQLDPNNWILKDSPIIGTGAQISPYTFELYQNYPNPFNPSTVISYQLSVISKVSLKIYDVLGKEVATLVNEVQQAGEHKVIFNVETPYPKGTSMASFPSGVYFYQLWVSTPSGKSDNFIDTKKMILIK
jgi:aminopeptidase N